jgi:hypothetical protein
MYLLQGSVSEILLNSLDILTFVVPPILPAALTANNAFAQRRLQVGFYTHTVYTLHLLYFTQVTGEHF